MEESSVMILMVRRTEAQNAVPRSASPLLTSDKLETDVSKLRFLMRHYPPCVNANDMWPGDLISQMYIL